MGVRYRKSINLGRGFRINISKSGIGYSYGVRGYRVTKTAKGSTRTTVSIPGTGISYVTETGKKKKGQSSTYNPTPAPAQTVSNNVYDTKIIENSVATNMVSEGLEDILTSARRSIRCNNIANWGLWIFGILSCGGVPIWIGLFLVFMALKVYVRTKGRIGLEYVIDDDQQEIIKERMKPMLKVTESAMVWRIMQTSKVVDKKYASGASNEVKRVACKASTTAPFPFKSNATCATFKTGKEYLVFMPDKLFVIQKKKIGALSYSDIQTNSHLQRFIEDGAIPKDAVVVGKTWKYVNKSGGPDKRFKDNRELPICQYGEIELSSTSGLNTVLMFSKIDLS